MEVEALGRINGEQVFSIGAGEANILGWKRVRETSLRLAVPEEPDLEAIAAEPHTYVDDAGSAVLTVLRPPIAAVTQAVVVKQVSEGVVRGSPADTADALGQSSVVSVLSVTQGGTTYVEGDDYTVVGNTISWAPGGAEPATGSTYTVVYRYNEAVTPDEVTDTTVTVSGGVDGTTALLSYTSKLPRIDLICLDRSGRAEYVKGVSARFGAIPPRAPSTLLGIAEVWNDWMDRPQIENNGVRNYTYEEQRRYFRRLVTLLNQFDRSELERDVLARAPVAREGIFTDAFVDDFYRDQGAAQTAAINRGVLQLAIEPILVLRVGTDVVLPGLRGRVHHRADRRDQLDADQSLHELRPDACGFDARAERRFLDRARHRVGKPDHTGVHRRAERAARHRELQQRRQRDAPRRRRCCAKSISSSRSRASALEKTCHR